MYTTLKAIHVVSVLASGAGFLLRGMLMLAGSPSLQSRFTRIAPHVIDTLLLASAVAMATIARLNPLDHAWLAAKIGALLVYIVLGSIALKRGRTRRARLAAFGAAIGTYAYIAAVALTRDPFVGLG